MELNLFSICLFIVLIVVLLTIKVTNSITRLFGQEIYLSKYREEINKGYKHIYSHQLVCKDRTFESEKNPNGIAACRNFIKTDFDSSPYFSYDQEFLIRYRKTIFGNFIVVVINER